MTAEIYRPGVIEPLKLPEGGLLELPLGTGELIVSLQEGEGFKVYNGIDIPQYQKTEVGFDGDGKYQTYQPGSVKQFGDGLLVKAT